MARRYARTAGSACNVRSVHPPNVRPMLKVIANCAARSGFLPWFYRPAGTGSAAARLKLSNSSRVFRQWPASFLVAIGAERLP